MLLSKRSLDGSACRTGRGGRGGAGRVRTSRLPDARTFHRRVAQLAPTAQSWPLETPAAGRHRPRTPRPRAASIAQGSAVAPPAPRCYLKMKIKSKKKEYRFPKHWPPPHTSSHGSRAISHASGAWPDMLITKGRSRAGEGVVTKGQDGPDRSGLVPCDLQLSVSFGDWRRDFWISVLRFGS